MTRQEALREWRYQQRAKKLSRPPVAVPEILGFRVGKPTMLALDPAKVAKAYGDAAEVSRIMAVIVE